MKDKIMFLIIGILIGAIITTVGFLIYNNSLIISPEGSTAEIIYDKKLNIWADIKFDFKILLIVIFITFLFSYKLLNYVADFNTIKKKPVYEVIFLSIFFSFLFLPMSHINNDKISLKENRVLAEYPSLFLENGELNNKFGSSYNKWFNDRFTYRNFLIKLLKFVEKKWKI